MRIVSRLPFLRPKPASRRWRWMALGGGMFLLLFGLYAYLQLGALRELSLLRMTGFPGGREYLVVFQNDAERRPTGGFITAYAVLKFRFGLPLLSFGNVYDARLLDSGGEVFPDPSVAALLSGPDYPGHGFRDGNFDPDFPTTAVELIRLYRAGYPDAQFDGVLAFDNTAFARLIDAVGGLSVDGVRFRSDLFFSQIEDFTQDIDTHDEEQLSTRKNILAGLAKRLLAKTVLQPWHIDDVADSLTTSLADRHALLWSADETLQAQASSQSWTGALPYAAEGDMLAVIEGNYGGMKSSRYITRDTSYDVELLENIEQRTKNLEGLPLPSGEGWGEGVLTARAHVKITLAHRGASAEPISGYYQGYWRVYAPLGSQLVRGTAERTEEDGLRTIFGQTIKMAPGEEEVIKLVYDLPASSLAGQQYRLHLPKAAGSAADPIRVSVRAPYGYRFVAAESADRDASDVDMDTRELLAVWGGVLDRDYDLAISLLPDTVPPRVASQAFGRDFSTVRIRWNEPLAPATVMPAAFTVTDRNAIDPRTNVVVVSGVRLVDPQTVELSVDGITPVCRERYDLAIDGVADIHGNVVTGKVVTVIQSLDGLGQRCARTEEEMEAAAAGS